MRPRAVLCLLVLLGLAACRREGKIPGSSIPAVTCDPEEPTQLCFQIGSQKPVVLLPGDGKLSISVERGLVFARFRAGRKSYSVQFGPEAAGQIVPGVYRNAINPGFFNRPEAPKLDVDLDGFCAGPGSFVLDDIAFDDTGTIVRRLDVTFEIARCGSGRDLPARGRVRLDEVRQGLKDRLARFFGFRVPERPPPPILSLQTVDELCPVDADRFLCLQGNAGAWAAPGRRQVFIRRKGMDMGSQINWGGDVKLNVYQVHGTSTENVDIDLSPRHGTLLEPGLYQSSDTKQDNETEPILKVGQCNLARRGPNRFYVYEAELGLDLAPRHFLADFEARCGTDVAVGRLALDSKLVAKARVEAAGDPGKLREALARILGERRKRIAVTPLPVVSLETVDSFCPDREGTFLCFRSTAGEDMGQGRSINAGPPITAKISQNGAITVSLPPWKAAVELAPPPGEELRPGATYEDAHCSFPYFGGSGPTPYLSLAVNTPGGTSMPCRPEYRGRFQILTLDRQEDGSLQNVAATFELRTAGGAPVAGRLRVTGADENNAQAATVSARESAPVPSPSPAQAPPLPAVPEADARCSADGRTFERRGDVWMESGTERSQPAAVITRGQDPKFDLMALKARIWTALNLGPKVRTYVDGKVTEILQGEGYPKDPFAGVRCEIFGKVRLPRRTAEMGSALDAQLRKDGKRGLRVSARFVVDRNGKVGELLAADGLPDEYRDLFLQDLQKMTYQPATLDGRPVPVVQSGMLTY